MAEHTPEPWSAHDNFDRRDGRRRYVYSNGPRHRTTIAHVLSPWHRGADAPEVADANQARIVASVNACTGIPTPSLETAGPGAVLELVEALKATHSRLLCIKNDLNTTRMIMPDQKSRDIAGEIIADANKQLKANKAILARFKPGEGS